MDHSVVTRMIADHLQEQAAGHRILASAEARTSQGVTDIAPALAGRVRQEGISAARLFIVTGRIGCNQVQLVLDPAALGRALDQPAEARDEAFCRITAPFACRHRGVETRIIAGTRKPLPDPALLRALRHAHRWGEAVKPHRAIAPSETVSGGDRKVAATVCLSRSAVPVARGETAGKSDRRNRDKGGWRRRWDRDENSYVIVCSSVL